MATTSELLAACEAALLKAMVSQEYYIGPRRQRMAELDKLKKLRDELKDEIAAESEGGSMCTLAVNVGVNQ